MELTVEQVREWLAENKETDEVKKFLGELVPEHTTTAEEVTAYLETADGKELVKPMIDQRVNQAVKTYREGHFDSEVKKQVAAEMLKLNPQDSPEQKQIKELQAAFEAEKASRAKDNLKRQIVEEAARMKVDAFFVDDYLPASIEEGKLFLQKIDSWAKSRDERIKNELLAQGFKPGSGKPEGDDKDPMKGIDPNSLSPENLAKAVAVAEKELADRK